MVRVSVRPPTQVGSVPVPAAAVKPVPLVAPKSFVLPAVTLPLPSTWMILNWTLSPSKDASLAARERVKLKSAPLPAPVPSF